MILNKKVSFDLYVYGFLRLLVMKWEDTDAYKLGLLDSDGKKLKSPSTSEEKSAYTYFHRLVFNVKRLIEKAPGGKSKIASFITALYLIKEEYGLSDKSIDKILSKMEINIDLKESNSSWFIDENNNIRPGRYSLTRNVMIADTAEELAIKGSRVVIESHTSPTGWIACIPIYLINHLPTNRNILITSFDLIR